MCIIVYQCYNHTMMKNIVCLLLTLCLLQTAMASDPSAKEIKRFDRKAELVIAKMKHTADSLSVQGVCMIAYIPGTPTGQWASRMMVVGKMKTGDANLLAIVYSKAAEMADTYQNSGSGARPLLKFECGYKGGRIMARKSGYLIAAFSGGKDEQDLAISQSGLDELTKVF